MSQALRSPSGGERFKTKAEADINKWAAKLKSRIKLARSATNELERVIQQMESDLEATRRRADIMMMRIEATEPKPEDFGLPADTPRPDHEYVGLKKWSREGAPNRFYSSKT